MSTLLNRVNQYKDEIDLLHCQLDKAFMNDYIKPFCNKWHISFFSGMGVYGFTKRSGKIIHGDEYERITNTFYNALKDFEKEISLINDITLFLGGSYDYNYNK